MTRRTKVVATIGPASSSKEKLLELLNAGVNVFRLNFSHGKSSDKKTLINDIRDLSEQMSLSVAILGDLQGPKIRVGEFVDGQTELREGEVVIFKTTATEGNGRLIPTTYEALPHDVTIGDRILLDDGLLEVVVQHIGNDEVYCKVIVGGILKNRKGMNLPGVNISAPSLTEKDREDLDFCIQQKVDYIALSFVRTSEDIINIKEILKENNSDISVIAKIEKPEAVENFDSILEATDGIMVARGDLGVEISAERVPLIQKRIIASCNKAGKPVITATQMLESMVTNARPTRAETSDVANAIIDGTDAVMLSAETASGKYPVESVKTMIRIAIDVEKDVIFTGKRRESMAACSGRDLTEAIGHAACCLSDAIGAVAILAFTQTGGTAALVAKHRPRVPIIAATPLAAVRRKLALYSGVYSFNVENTMDTEEQIKVVEKQVMHSEILNKDDLVVITMGSPVSVPGTTNLLKAMRLGEYENIVGGTK